MTAKPIDPRINRWISDHKLDRKMRFEIRRAIWDSTWWKPGTGGPFKFTRRGGAILVGPKSYLYLKSFEDVDMLLAMLAEVDNNEEWADRFGWKVEDLNKNYRGEPEE